MMALKPAQVKLLDELLNPAHGSIEAAAEAAGVARRTAYTWLERADFRIELDQAEGRTIDGIARRTVSSLTEAERLYTTFVADESRDDSIRLKAAQQLTDLALRLWEARHVLRRLDELERRIDETQ